MKTPEQKAEEYLKSIYEECFDDPCYTPDVAQSKKDFLAGYKAANEWISVEDELPKRGIDVLCKSKSFFESGYNEVCILIGFLRVDKDEFIVSVWNQHDMMYESLETAKVEYWKPIE